jgi:hypothetical protein
MFEPKSEEVTGGWRKVHVEEFCNLCSSPNIIRMVSVTKGGMCGACTRHGRVEKCLQNFGSKTGKKETTQKT